MDISKDLIALVYVRNYGLLPEEETEPQIKELSQKAHDMNYTDIKVYHDNSYPKQNRKAIKNLLRYIRRNHINAVVIDHTNQISHNPNLVFLFLKKLQDYGVNIICIQSNISYELYLNGKEKFFLRRAEQRNLCVPWKEI